MTPDDLVPLHDRVHIHVAVLGVAHISELLHKFGEDVWAALLYLELSGIIKQLPGKQFSIKQ